MERFLLSAWVLLLVGLLMTENGHCGFIDDEEQLRRDLLGNYSVEVRPYSKTYISLIGTLVSLNHLDIALQSMSINIMFIIMWHDPRLVWTPANYGGLEFLVTAPENIWTPPIVIENAVNDVGVLGGKDRDATPVRISSAGIVQWYPPQEVTTSCEMLIAKYPFDTQTCGVTLIGWTYPLSEMNITALNIDSTSLYTKHGEFEIQSSRAFYNDLGGPLESDTYRKVNLEFSFRRKWQFYGQNLLMPIVLNSILMNAVFALPIESGEKMGYSLTVLLSYIVFLTWVTENLPPVSTDTSILQVYLAVVLCLGCLATLLTTWVLHLYHRPDCQPVYRRYRRFAVTVLLPLYRRLHCLPQGRGDDGDGREEKAEGRVAAVKPIPSRTISARLQHNGHGNSAAARRPTLRAQSRLAFVDADGTMKSLGTDHGFDNNHDDGDDDDSGGENLRWQDIAMLMDHFFLWVFGLLLLILTTVILSLLYSGY